MADWLSSMQQTFEYYVVDPGTWKDTKLLTNVKSCTINRDSSVETRGSATISITESIGECYVRVYLVTTQNGVKEKHPLGTFLVQTPSSSFNGKIKEVSMDAYTPLIELKEVQPPIGYFIPKSTSENEVNIMDIAYRLARENVRAPVVKTENSTLNQSDFVSDTSDTWLSFLSDFVANQVYVVDQKTLANARYELDLDEMGRIIFSPKQDTASLQPVWTYDDGNSSILYPDINIDHDLYNVPNVVEVVYTNGGDNWSARAENRNPNSPTSIQNRGREIVRRVINPDLYGNPTKAQVQEYADQFLEALSTLEYTVTYTHAYCPVRVGDCVRLNYSRGGLVDIKAKVVSQSIKCTPGCPVSEKSVYVAKLWR